MESIKSLTGAYAFMSSEYYVLFEYEGVLYKSAESAYQAARCVDPRMRGMFVNASGKEARVLGLFISEKPNWDFYKQDVMYDITLAKFQQNPKLYQQLYTTGDTPIKVDFIGSILMKVRDCYNALS